MASEEENNESKKHRGTCESGSVGVRYQRQLMSVPTALARRATRIPIQRGWTTHPRTRDVMPRHRQHSPYCRRGGEGAGHGTEDCSCSGPGPRGFGLRQLFNHTWWRRRRTGQLWGVRALFDQISGGKVRGLVAFLLRAEGRCAVLGEATQPSRQLPKRTETLKTTWNRRNNHSGTRPSSARARRATTAAGLMVLVQSPSADRRTPSALP